MWMRSNRLQPNPAKTEVLWLSSSRKQFTVPPALFSVGSNAITPSSTVRDLGIHLDSLGSHNDRAHFQDSVKLLRVAETNP